MSQGAPATGTVRFAECVRRAERFDPSTVVVAVAVYGTLVALLVSHSLVPWPVTVVALGLVSAWHGSLQHELIHGHGIPPRWLAAAVALPTLNLWLPYRDYERTHLLHHIDEHLTDPFDDPESTYLAAAQWKRLPAPLRAVCWANRSLVGRFVIGPPIATVRYLAGSWALARGDRWLRRTWAVHGAMVALTLVMVRAASIPVWEYALGAVWLGTSFTLVRSFAEHTWVDGHRTKTAMTHTNRAMALLYLNNNLHLAHHERPDVAWTALPAIAVSADIAERAKAGAGVFVGYGEILRRWGFRAKCQPAHPAQVGALPVPRPLRGRVRGTAE